MEYLIPSNLKGNSRNFNKKRNLKAPENDYEKLNIPSADISMIDLETTNIYNDIKLPRLAKA